MINLQSSSKVNRTSRRGRREITKRGQHMMGAHTWGLVEDSGGRGARAERLSLLKSGRVRGTRGLCPRSAAAISGAGAEGASYSETLNDDISRRTSLQRSPVHFEYDRF